VLRLSIVFCHRSLWIRKTLVIKNLVRRKNANQVAHTIIRTEITKVLVNRMSVVVRKEALAELSVEKIEAAEEVAEIGAIMMTAN